MKKMFAVVLSAAFLLVGCGGDNGELAGVYQDSSKDRIVLDFKNSSYEIQYLTHFNGNYSKPTLVGFAKKDGDYLVGDNNKKMFEISGDEIISVYSPKKYTYKKVE